MPLDPQVRPCVAQPVRRTLRRSFVYITQALATCFLAMAAPAAAQSLGGGADHTVVAKPDGTVWVWGSNASGQLGNGSAIADAAQDSRGGAGADQRDCDRRRRPAHAGALERRQRVGLGRQRLGTVGRRVDHAATVARAGQQSDGVIAIAAGNSFSLALKSDGTVWAWGY